MKSLKKNTREFICSQSILPNQKVFNAAVLAIKRHWVNGRDNVSTKDGFGLMFHKEIDSVLGLKYKNYAFIISYKVQMET